MWGGRMVDRGICHENTNNRKLVDGKASRQLFKYICFHFARSQKAKSPQAFCGLNIFTIR